MFSERLAPSNQASEFSADAVEKSPGALFRLERQCMVVWRAATVDRRPIRA